MRTRNFKFIRSRPGEARRDGCGFLLLTCLFTCFLLVLNCLAVARLYPWIAAATPGFLRDSRMQPLAHQLTMFIAPVVLTFCQWWLVDLIVELLTPRRRS